MSKDYSLSDKMLDALRGNFERRDEEVTGRQFVKRERGSDSNTAPIIYWSSLFGVDEEGCLKTINDFPQWDKKRQSLLEAFVILPEKAGLAKVERVVNGYYESRGFLNPEYAEEAIESIYDSASKHFEGNGDIWGKYGLLKAVNDLAPRGGDRFTNIYRERMLNGLKSTKFTGEHEEEVLWANLTSAMERAGFGALDGDFVKTLWEKSKTIPVGYLDSHYGAQEILARALVERDAKGLMGFDYVRENIPYSNLSQILSMIPVREGVERQGWRARHRFPGEKIYAPILKFIDKTLREEKK